MIQAYIYEYYGRLLGFCYLAKSSLFSRINIIFYVQEWMACQYDRCWKQIFVATCYIVKIRVVQLMCTYLNVHPSLVLAVKFVPIFFGSSIVFYLVAMCTHTNCGLKSLTLLCNLLGKEVTLSSDQVSVHCNLSCSIGIIWGLFIFLFFFFFHLRRF